MKVYAYSKCSTCRKAIKWLDAAGYDYRLIDITEKPPAKTELTKILKSDDYELKELFNRSGQEYRKLKLKDKLPNMSQADAISLLNSNGRLVKRPIVIDDAKATVGYKEDVFEEVWG